MTHQPAAGGGLQHCTPPPAAGIPSGAARGDPREGAHLLLLEGGCSSPVMQACVPYAWGMPQPGGGASIRSHPCSTPHAAAGILGALSHC
jgi:hypothetical protein